MPGLEENNTAAMSVVDSDDSVKAMIQHLARDNQHKLVKPYYLYLDYDYDLPSTNTTADEQFVQIRNARKLGISSREMFSKCGFAQLHLTCPLTPEEYWYNEKVEKILYPKYKSIARFLFPNAVRVEVLEHAVRKRHPRWMSENIERNHLKTNQPSDYIHIDYESQTTAMDVVTHNFANENARVYFDEKHEWYYWHGLQVDEVIAFVQADSAAENKAGVPHTAFQDPRINDNKQLRESIEARVFVYFD
ncbi:uncharacterized protein EAE97_007010 [Botrytis byssoidea]|uniref:Methyltransferase n=1 Tax=Botrytis byssoidea TaxID=139641 RepID=A0A9P5LYC5_9HELO|nr:uncharacterized protein EAE97_007010 [Botrytis byssoidea]KAF7940824.1 hypothetical protein EAE97_007010 [Botrytis byssoidea]